VTLPNTFEKNTGKIGLVIGFACSGRLITPEMVLAMQMQQDPTHLNHATIIMKGMPVEIAREKICEKALEVGAKYIWFVDDDTVPPPNTARKLMYVLDNNPDIKVCGGCYVTKCDPNDPVPQPVLFRGMGQGSFWHWKKGDVFEVTGMGAGCMMINTNVFQHLEKPWFRWERHYNEEAPDDNPVGMVSEDIAFCNAVRNAGFKVFAHGGILCDHFDVTTGETWQFTPDMYPLNSNTTDLETVPTPEMYPNYPSKNEKGITNGESGN
jgi:cellulose synthase/poly-beta-1,6-N-acetylglucosamine synthase-like glycosyltransferase